MTLLYNDPVFLEHETGPEPERGDRIRGFEHRLTAKGLAQQCRRPAWDHILRHRIARVHSLRYVDEVRNLAKMGGGELEMETYVSPGSYRAASMAAGCVCDATERIIRGEDAQALCLIRPPGHHARPAAAMGFCIFNNVAIAAKLATEEYHVGRVLIVDWDVHHGNGTQDIFWEDPLVGVFSIHRAPFYPGTGRADETGEGRGRGTTFNVPIEYGTPRRTYLERFRVGLHLLATRMRPHLIFISAGFDAHRLDPVGDLGLEAEDFAAMTNMVLDVAEIDCGGRVISMLEGGYDPLALTDCVEAHLTELLKRNRFPTSPQKSG